MANVFKLKTDTGVGTTLTTIYTVPTSPSTTTIIIGCLLANIHASAQVKANVQIVTAAVSGENGDDVYLIKSVPVPHGSSLEIVEGKIVMQAGDIIKISSDTAASVDVALSVLEQT
jgi:uncharacterized Zn ribbon protein